MRIGYWLLNALHWLCTTVGALVIAGFLTLFCRSCYYDHKPESVLYGTWDMVQSENGYYDTLTFDWDGEYYNSNTGNETWNYEYIEPDSLILYHHVLYEERYKIIKLTQDTLIMKLSESIFHAVDNGKEIEADYSGGEQPIYTYIRKNHRRTPQP